MTKTPDGTPPWARTLQQGLSLSPVGVLLVIELAASESPLTFGELAQRVDASRSVMSDRLRALEQAGLIHASVPAELRKGRRPYVYWLDRDALREALAAFAASVEMSKPGTNTGSPAPEQSTSPQRCDPDAIDT